MFAAIKTHRLRKPTSTESVFVRIPLLLSTPTTRKQSVDNMKFEVHRHKII